MKSPPSAAALRVARRADEGAGGVTWAGSTRTGSTRTGSKAAAAGSDSAGSDSARRGSSTLRLRRFLLLSRGVVR